MEKEKSWAEWDAQGLFPGPKETEEEFLRRAEFCLNLEKNHELPFDVDESSAILLKEAFPLTDQLYGIQPSWVPLFFSNYQLAPWHGGCAWIFQLKENSPTTAFLQLRRRFLNSSHFFGIYNRTELIAHELSHVGRMLYEEPQFEEFFAYQSSTSRWRRWLGPIVQSSQESFFFLLLLGIMLLTDLALIAAGSPTMLICILELLPLGFVGFALSRLIKRHRILKQCMRNLELIYSHRAKHLCYRLRDSEIKEFSHMSALEILKFIKESSVSNFRWRFLKAVFVH